MDDRDRVKSELAEAGIAGIEDFGRFVNDTTYFAPSSFDERAAAPVLLQLLPSLTDARVVMTVAMYLQGRWVGPDAFDVLSRAFKVWAPKAEIGAGWQLGLAVGRAGTFEHLPTMLRLAKTKRYGRARQMVVDSLWRFRKDPGVASVLMALCEDPDVCLHAMSAYRRTVGNQEAAALLKPLTEHPDSNVRTQAKKALRKAEKALQNAS